MLPTSSQELAGQFGFSESRLDQDIRVSVPVVDLAQIMVETGWSTSEILTSQPEELRQLVREWLQISIGYPQHVNYPFPLRGENTDVILPGTYRRFKNGSTDETFAKKVIARKVPSIDAPDESVFTQRMRIPGVSAAYFTVEPRGDARITALKNEFLGGVPERKGVPLVQQLGLAAPTFSDGHMFDLLSALHDSGSLSECDLLGIFPRSKLDAYYKERFLRTELPAKVQYRSLNGLEVVEIKIFMAQDRPRLLHAAHEIFCENEGL